MIAKKSKKANLERRRFAFFQIGLLVAGSSVLAAFEYTSADVHQKNYTLQDEGSTHVLRPEAFQDPIKDMPKEEKVQTTAVVDLMQVDSFIIDNHIKDPGNTQIVSNGNITMEGEFDPYGEIGLGIEDPGDGTIHTGWVDEFPEFPGGEKAMYAWLGERIRYPELCAEMGIEGMAYVEFVVNKDGSICQVKGLGAPHELLSKEAIRVVKQMPKWKAGEQAGKKVRVRYTIPVNYQLH